MANLVVDIGNTLVKVAVVEADSVVSLYSSVEYDYSYMAEVIAEFKIARAIVCSVRNYDSTFAEFIEGSGVELVEFTCMTPTPIVNGYGSPQTLGRDRLAAAVGAFSIYGGGANILIVDIGSAITIDMVCCGVYAGGNISPGAELRYKALNEHTDKLPLLSVESDAKRGYCSDNTISAIVSGVELGIVLELEGYIAYMQKRYSNVNIIFTGGRGKYFADMIKNTIFVCSNLVVIGLSKILNEFKSE